MDQPERLIRSAFLTGRSYGATAEADLVRILDSSAPEIPPRRRPRIALGSGLVAVLVVALIGGLLFTRTQPAHAVTPPMLQVATSSRAPAELLDSLADSRLAGPEPAPRITIHGWYLNSTVDQSGELSHVATEPQVTAVEFQRDQSIRRRTTAGTPFPGQASEGLPKPGTYLGEDRFTAHELDGIYPLPIPTDPTLLRLWLEHVEGRSGLTAGSAIEAMTGLITARQISAAQEAAFLRLLGSMPDVAVLGTTTDRLGRPGWIFRAASSNPSFEQRLIVSKDGILLATESIYVGSDHPLLTPPSVVSYAAWDRLLEQ